MHPLQIPPTMAPPHVIKNERCLKCLITCNFRPWPLSTGGPSSVHKLPHVLILFCILRAIIEKKFNVRILYMNFFIFWTADKNTKVWWSMNDLKVVEKGTWQNSGLTRNRTLACDKRLNSGRSRGGPGSPLIFPPKWGPKCRKNFFSRPGPPFFKDLDDRTPPPPYLKVLIRHCLTCPKDLVYIYTIFFEIYIKFLIQRLYIVYKKVSKHTVIYAPSLHHFDLSF